MLRVLLPLSRFATADAPSDVSELSNKKKKSGGVFFAKRRDLKKKVTAQDERGQSGQVPQHTDKELDPFVPKSQVYVYVVFFSRQ